MKDELRIFEKGLGGALLALGVCASALCGGCVNYRSELAQRATFDLGCEVHESDVVQIGSTLNFGVTACGCRATYVTVQGGFALNGLSGEACSGPATVGATSGGEGR